MKLRTEIISETQKALIICSQRVAFLPILKTYLEKKAIEVCISSKEPPSFEGFNYLIAVDNPVPVRKIDAHPGLRYLFIFAEKKPSPFFLNLTSKRLFKIVRLASKQLTIEEVEKIVWFGLSSSSENILEINNPSQRPMPNQLKKSFSLASFFSSKTIFRGIIFFMIGCQLIFLPFFLLSIFFTLISLREFRKENFSKTKTQLVWAKDLSKIANNLYQQVDQNFRFVGISQPIENLLSLNQLTIDSVKTAIDLIDNLKKINQLVFTKDKSEEEKTQLHLRIQEADRQIDKITHSLDKINQKITLPLENFRRKKAQLAEVNEMIVKKKPLFDYLKKIVTQKNISRYLIFFANNSELRPGGGFIGSIAIVEIGDFEIKNLKVYDVYDLDGQIKVHVDPPKPLSKYLNLPHLFLRDSNFSPDFVTNYQKGVFFVEKSLGISHFDGTILLTTTAVENLLNAFGEIYLPDYKEFINSKNFFLKTQLHVEKNFFPGSNQKENFLSELLNQLIINLDQASLFTLITNFKKSLDEKQIVVYLDNQQTQTIIDSFFWSGRLIDTKCLTQSKPCLVNYIFPVETNVGANKANFFIKKYYSLKLFFDQNIISHQLTIKYENTSPSEIFPTGFYRNYFQVFLPINSVINSITKNGVLVEDYDQKDDFYKVIGFYFEIPPKKNLEIKINYSLNQSVSSGKSLYQLIFQKQIGEKNSDLILEFYFDKKLSLLDQNFRPLVKNNQIIYNTTLNTDKIFLLEIEKK
ncbi:MAG: DUF4012 domain-containing protein [Patescibacteria group bacterium]|nr:DUF4012 domain-containing protein [Patescibacteria group bacterium]